MVWLKVEARVAIGMELQDVEVSVWKVTPELKTGWGFMGSKMLSWFSWRYKPRFMRWLGWKERPELSAGWSFKASKLMKW